LTAQDIADAQQALARGEIPPFLNGKDFYPDQDVKQFAGTDRLVVEQMVLFSDGPVLVPLLHGYKKDGSQFYIDQDRHIYRGGFPQKAHVDVADLAQPIVCMRSTALHDLLEDNPWPEGTLYFHGEGASVSTMRCAS
jgi:hypothetical protein